MRSETAESTPLEPFSEPVRRWFQASFAAADACPGDGLAADRRRGQHADLRAHRARGRPWPRSCGGSIGLARRNRSALGQGVRIVYVSPLKALSYDIERNLRAPLKGIEAGISVGLRTGDTPQRERQAMRRKPPDILITTPESLYLIMTSGAREILTGAEAVIVDEIHAVAQSKRGRASGADPGAALPPGERERRPRIFSGSASRPPSDPWSGSLGSWSARGANARSPTPASPRSSTSRSGPGRGHDRARCLDREAPRRRRSGQPGDETSTPRRPRARSGRRSTRSS